MKKLSHLLLFLLLFQGINTYAQSASFDITIEGSQPDFTFNTITDYETGITYPAATKFTVTAEKGDDWTIYFKSQNSSFSTGVNSMPLNIFKVQVQGFTARFLSTIDQVLASDNPTNKKAISKTYTIDYSVSAPGYSYVVGTYTSTIIYTITVR